MKKNYISPVICMTEVDMSECILSASPLSLKKSDIFADESDALVNFLDDTYTDIWDNEYK